MWEGLGIDPHDNAGQALEVVKGVLAALPTIPSDDLALTDEVLGPIALPPPVSASEGFD